MSTTPKVIPGWRVAMVALALVLLLVALMARISVLQVWPQYEQGYAFLQAQGDARTNRVVGIPAARGMILDRDGRPLAVSTPVVSVWADPEMVTLSDEDIAALALVLEMPFESLQLRLRDSTGRRFIYLKRGMNPVVIDALRPFQSKGVHMQEEFRRFYPTGEVSAHLLGLTNIDDFGQEGVELSLDSLLRGQSGSQRIVRDRAGRVITSAEVLNPAQPGQNVVLTLDARLQYVAYRELKTAVMALGASAGSLVIMDVHSGELLAMANQPAFNPNNRADILPAALRNRAVTDLFEPGSTIKAFTALAALESGRYQPDTIIDTSPGRMVIDGKAIYDPSNYGRLTLTDVVAKSSQVGTARIALDLNPDDLSALLSRVGLGEAPGLGFPGESPGSVPQRYRWQQIEQATLAYGYGVSVSALQLAQAYAIFGNGGMRVTPKLYLNAPDMPPVQVADPHQTAQVLEMLRAVVARGTGSRAAAPSYLVAGKTGTVHMVGATGYEDHKYSAIFAGIAPFDDPQIVMVVVIHDPGPDAYSGGVAAAPVFAATAEASLRILGVPPTSVTGARPLLIGLAGAQ